MKNMLEMHALLADSDHQHIARVADPVGEISTCAYRC